MLVSSVEADSSSDVLYPQFGAWPYPQFAGGGETEV